MSFSFLFSPKIKRVSIGSYNFVRKDFLKVILFRRFGEKMKKKKLKYLSAMIDS